MSTTPLYPLGEPNPGEIVSIYAPVAGYPKYHLCLSGCSDSIAAKFLYINSEDQGFKDDLVLSNSHFTCIPPCPSGLSVVSCNEIVPVNRKQLSLYGAKVIGSLDPTVARLLEDFISTKVTSLNAIKKRFALEALALVV